MRIHGIKRAKRYNEMNAASKARKPDMHDIKLLHPFNEEAKRRTGTGQGYQLPAAFFLALLLIAPCTLFAQNKQTALEESLTRANVLYHAGAHSQSLLLYENALDLVDKDWQKDLLNYNIGSNLLAEGEPQAALDLWSTTHWSPSPAPWLTRRLSWNCSIAFIQKAAYVDASQPEGQLEQIRLLHAALKMLEITSQAECIWHRALSSSPCTPTLKLQEASEWTRRRLFTLQETFREWWIAHAAPLDLIGAILAAMERFEESDGSIDCASLLQQIEPYARALDQFPSLDNQLRPSMMNYQKICKAPFDAQKLHAAKEAFQQSAMDFSNPFYLNKENKKMRLLYAQGLAEGGNLFHALHAAKLHRVSLKGSQEGEWAGRCALLGETAFNAAQFETARLFWQLTCFWMDEQAALLDHLPQLDETGQRLLTRHLWTQFFATHLTLLSNQVDETALIEGLTQLVQSTLGTAASLFALAREAQAHAFQDNHCSTVAWDKALPLISHGEVFMHNALRMLQEHPIAHLSQHPAITSTMQHAYPFWVEGVKALQQTQSAETEQHALQEPAASPLSTPDQSLSLQQRTLLLQEMEAEDRPTFPHPTPPAKEARPW